MYDTLYFLPFEIFLKIIWKLVISKPQVRLSVKQNFGLGTYRPTCIIRCTRFHEPRPILKPQAWIPKANHVHLVTPTETIKPTQTTQHNAKRTKTSLMARLYKQSQHCITQKNWAYAYNQKWKKMPGCPRPTHAGRDMPRPSETAPHGDPARVCGSR